MKVLTPGGEVTLGTLETAPTIGIADYSRRTTDAFGVTTVVPRGFSRQMALKFQLPTDQVDGVQRQLAELRATAATWVADDRFAWLSMVGFYKDLSIAIPGMSVSTCSLTVEGLAETETLADPGGDPAPAGTASSLQLLQPIDVTDTVLVASSVAETDYPEWSASTTYAVGARVIKAATHRIYESVLVGNVGHDPAAATGEWLDIGPTSRWAMFDQSLGTVTTGDQQIVVTLKPEAAVNGLAILDTDAGMIRVQAPGYDRTQLRSGVPADPNAALFLDLVVAAGATITVTVGASDGSPGSGIWIDSASWVDGYLGERGSAVTNAATGPRPWIDGGAWVDDAGTGASPPPPAGSVSVGTLLIGTLAALGVTEASPTAGITDYSKKERDEFGEVTVVPRAWAKRMSARALIRTDALDVVANRIASVRARPSLWIGDAGLDSLIVYGFFKSFSIEVGGNVSNLSLEVEGLSTAGRVGPLKVSIDWPDVADPAGNKPANNATNSADPSSPFGPGGTVGDALGTFDRLENDIIPAVERAVQDAQDAIDAAKAAAAGGVADANQRIADANARITAANDRITAANLQITAANTRLDTARTDLDRAFDDIAAEIARAQGADEDLAHRIDAIVATGGDNDSDLRALVATEVTARADADRAIGQRIDTVETDYKGRDTATNARVTAETTARSDADGALGRRVDTVVTDYKAADVSVGALVTAEASARSTADGAIAVRIDAVEADYKGLNTATNTRITTQVSALSDADTALGQRIDSIVAEGGYDDTNVRTLIQSSSTASVDRDAALGGRIDTVTTDYTTRDAATNTRITTQGTALSQADAAIGQRIDSVETDYKARDAATNTRITTQVTALSDADHALGQRIDAISASGGYDDTAVRAEITRVETASTDRDTALGHRIDTISASGGYDDTAVKALIQQASTASLDRDSALGQRIDTVTTEYQGKDTATNARISGVVTAYTNADLALSQRQDVMVGEYNGLNGTTNARITSEVAALAEADRAAASRTSTLEAQTGGNLLGNTDFASGTAGWTLVSNAPSSYSWGVDNANFTIAGDHYQGLLCLAQNGDFTGAIVSDWVAVQPGDVVQMSAWLASRECYSKIRLQWADGGASYLRDAAESATVGPPSTGWENLDGYRRVWCKSTVPGDARFARFVLAKGPFLANPNGFLSWAFFLRPMLALGSADQTAPSPYRPGTGSAAVRSLRASITEVATATTDGRFAAAQTVSTLRAEYNGTAATVSQQAGVITGLGQRTAAYVRVVADAGNGRAALSLWSDQYGGAWSLTGDGLIDGNLTVTGSLTSPKFAQSSVQQTMFLTLPTNVSIPYS